MPSVLIVDDLVSIHEMLDAVIQPTGFGTTFATDGEKALTRYKADKFDLVLGNVGFDQKGDITAPGYVLYVWKKGNFEYAD